MILILSLLDVEHELPKKKRKLTNDKRKRAYTEKQFRQDLGIWEKGTQKMNSLLTQFQEGNVKSSWILDVETVLNK